MRNGRARLFLATTRQRTRYQEKRCALPLIHPCSTHNGIACFQRDSRPFDLQFPSLFSAAAFRKSFRSFKAALRAFFERFRVSIARYLNFGPPDRLRDVKKALAGFFAGIWSGELHPLTMDTGYWVRKRKEAPSIYSWLIPASSNLPLLWKVFASLLIAVAVRAQRLPPPGVPVQPLSPVIINRLINWSKWAQHCLANSTCHQLFVKLNINALKLCEKKESLMIYLVHSKSQIM